MKIEFTADDSDALYEVMDGVFVGMLHRQLKNSREYLEQAYMQEDKDMNQGVINACLVLLDYYGGKDD